MHLSSQSPRRSYAFGALSIVVGFGLAAVLLAPAASAWHPNIAATAVCGAQPATADVTFTSVSWSPHGDDAGEGANAHISVLYRLSVDGAEGAWITLPWQTTYRYSVSNNFEFTGTFSLSDVAAGTLVQVRARADARWGETDDLGGQTQDTAWMIAPTNCTVPGTTIPATTVPETTIPDTTIPDTTVPETTIPATTVPETTVPETTIPATTVPETTIPATTVPETTVPPTTVPETTVPPTTSPGRAIPPTTETPTPEVTTTSVATPGDPTTVTPTTARTSETEIVAPTSTSSSTPLPVGAVLGVSVTRPVAVTGTLPTTGTKSALIGVAGLLCIVAGMALVIVGRRRSASDAMTQLADDTMSHATPTR